MSVIGWLLDPDERLDLLRQFPPAYANVVAHHVTLLPGAPPEGKLPTETSGEIVGEANDHVGVQSLVVSIGGTTARRTGGTYHITWSLEPGRKAVESNKVIEEYGWTRCSPVPVKLKPARF